MSGYAVVQFIKWGNGKSVLAVPCSWLVTVENQLKCYFPKSDCKRAVRIQSAVKGDWELHVVKKLSSKLIDTYTAALKKEKKAMITSGIDSDEEISDEENQSTKRPTRKRQRPIRLAEQYDSSFDCEESSNDDKQQTPGTAGTVQLPVPPKFYKKSVSLHSVLLEKNAMESSTSIMGATSCTNLQPPSIVHGDAKLFATMLHTCTANTGLTPHSPLTPSSTHCSELSNSVLAPFSTQSHVMSSSCNAVDTSAILSSNNGPSFATASQTGIESTLFTPQRPSNSHCGEPSNSVVASVSTPSHALSSSCNAVETSATLSPNNGPSFTTALQTGIESTLFTPQRLSNSHCGELSNSVVASVSASSHALSSSYNAVETSATLLPNYGPSLTTASQTGTESTEFFPQRPTNAHCSELFSGVAASDSVPYSAINSMDLNYVLYDSSPQLQNSSGGMHSAVTSPEIPEMMNAGTFGACNNQGSSLSSFQMLGSMITSAHNTLNDGDFRQASSTYGSTSYTDMNRAPRPNDHLHENSHAELNTPAFNTEIGSIRKQSQPMSLLAKLNHIMEAVDDLREKVNQLLNNCPTHTSDVTLEMETMDFSLPVDNSEAMDELGERLKDKNVKRRLRKCLLRVGGKTVGSGTYKIMKKCITHKLACTYSLVGQRKKLNFSAHPLYTVIVQSVLMTFKSETQDTVDGYISSFLKHSPEAPGCPRHKISKRSGTNNVRPRVTPDSDSN